MRTALKLAAFISVRSFRQTSSLIAVPSAGWTSWRQMPASFTRTKASIGFRIPAKRSSSGRAPGTAGRSSGRKDHQVRDSLLSSASVQSLVLQGAHASGDGILQALEGVVSDQQWPVQVQVIAKLRQVRRVIVAEGLVDASFIEAHTNVTLAELELGVVGLMNIQYAIQGDRLYVLEANPRASRTVPLVSKVCNVQMARLATQVMMGGRLCDLRPVRRPIPHFGVKEAVLPFDKLPEVDALLGPEMRSTGEVLGLAHSFGMAFFKAEEAAKPPLPTEGNVLISLAEKPPIALQVAQEFAALGFRILATEGTAAFLHDHGVPADYIRKLHEGRPHIADAIRSGEIQLVVNTPAGRLSEYDDSYIRKTAIRHHVPYITTLPAALASVRGIAARRQGGGGVCSLQEYHGNMAAPGQS